jgi:alkylation response protein AidB-like acyl-CoA dehydrogenase
VHDMLYKTSISLFGTEKQRNDLLPDVLERNVIGCFSMVSSNEPSVEVDAISDHYVAYSYSD